MNNLSVPYALGVVVLFGTALMACDNSKNACQGVFCDDDNVCTDDRCDAATGTCVYSPVIDGTECDFAGVPGVCRNGRCTDAGLCVGVDCDDGNDCTDERCIAATGLCEYTKRPDGSPCGDGGCEGGVCTSEFACSKEGMLNAIAAGGGPYTFACDGSTTISIGQIPVDNDVILDGETDLTVEGTFVIAAETVAEAAGSRSPKDGEVTGMSSPPAAGFSTPEP